jgi:hypothetical protein
MEASYRQRKGDSTPSFTRDLLVKKSEENLGSGAEAVDVGGLHLTPEALNDIGWISGSMYGGMCYYLLIIALLTCKHSFSLAASETVSLPLSAARVPAD